MKLKNGDILICSSNRLIPTIIKKATKSKWNHSAMFLTWRGIPGIIEAQEKGIYWIPFEEWKKKYNYEFVAYRNISLSQIEIDAIIKKAISKCGHTGYDFISFLIRQPLKLLTGKWKYKGEYKEMKFMICSEFVAWCYDMPNWWKMTPDDNKNYLNMDKNCYIVEDI